MIEIIKILIALAATMPEIFAPDNREHWSVEVNGTEIPTTVFSISGTEWTCYVGASRNLAHVRCCTDNVNQCVRADATTSVSTTFQLYDGDRAASISLHWSGDAGAK